MATKWKVYKNEKVFGVMTAAEIRQALREGVIDPFDFVCREGSTLRQEVVEVDEIFDDSVDYAAASKKGEASFSHDRTQISKVATSSIKPQKIRPEKPPKQARHQAAEEEEQENSELFGDLVNKKRSKNFYLEDKDSRVLGPLSGNEIQSLYNRGIIDKRVYVKRKGESKRIRIDHFIAAYSGDQIRGLKSFNDRGAWKDSGARLKAVIHKLPTTAYITQLHRGMSSRRRLTTNVIEGYSAYMLLGALLGLIVFLGVFIFNSGINRSASHSALPLIESNSVVKARPTVKRKMPPPREVPAKPVDEIVEPLSTKPVKSTRSPRQPHAKKPAIRQPKATKSLHPTPARPTAAVRTPAPTSASPANLSRNNRVLNNKPKVTPTPPNAAPRKKAITAPIAKPPHPPPAASGAGGTSELAANVGKVIVTSPVSFNKAEFASCPLKCQLTFRFPSGESFSAVFFKGPFIDAFERSSGTVRLHGRVGKKGNGYTVYIQGIN